MALLHDALSLVDDKLASIFSTPAYDPTKARKPLLSGIDKTLAQFSEGKTKVPHRWWSVSNNVVEFAPKLGGNPLQINSRDKLYIPAERFPDFLTKLKAAVEAGEFDDELKGNGTGDATVATPRAARKPREKVEGAEAGAGWSDERRARFAASIAARNVAKGK